MKYLSDEDLVRLFVEKQENQYFEILYERYSEKVYRKCLSFVKDTAKAEDFTHDIFLKLITSLPSYKETAKFSTWLYSITYNYCVDKVRTIKKLAEGELDEEFDLEDLEDDTELREIEAQRLRHALDKVSADEKAILLMKYQEDLSIKEIAELFGVTESAVKMRLLRAKEKVKKIFMDNVFFWVLLLIKVLQALR
jgi:RNA polymerase sigma factor (sigma-70 family)